jgi:hypothetical protein
LLHLLLLSNKPESKDNPKNVRQQACLRRFFPIFAAISRGNQVLLAEVLIDALDHLKERDMESSMVSVDEQALAAYVTDLTAFGMLGEDAAEKEVGIDYSHNFISLQTIFLFTFRKALPTPIWPPWFWLPSKTMSTTTSPLSTARSSPTWS